MGEQTGNGFLNDRLARALDLRRENGQLRYLQVIDGIDLWSNDYISLARNENLRIALRDWEIEYTGRLGSTGSRSISGQTDLARRLEEELAIFHRAEAGLVFNSGYDANLGFFAAVPQRQDHIVSDELIHASIIDGCRLSYATRHRFRHNDPGDLERTLQKINDKRMAGSQIFVVVETVYSMDGDQAPLRVLVELCERYGAVLVADEAHATGVFGEQGRGLISAHGLENRVFARIHTFGKALGHHGAVILGSSILKQYLINYARSFIFTTGLPPQSLAFVSRAYREIQKPGFDVSSLHHLIKYFKEKIVPPEGTRLIPSDSPIQCLVVPGSHRAAAMAMGLQKKGFCIKAIQHPSVAAGQERLRISLHLHNRETEIDRLAQYLHDFVNQ